MECQRAKQVYKHTQQRGRQPAEEKNAWRRQEVTRVNLFLSALPRHLGNWLTKMPAQRLPQDWCCTL